MEDPEVDHEAAAALVIDGGDGNPKKKRKIIPRGSCTNPACPRALTKQLTFFRFCYLVVSQSQFSPLVR